MLVTSQLPIQTSKCAIISFQSALVHPHFEEGSATYAITSGQHYSVTHTNTFVGSARPEPRSLCKI